MHCGIVRLSDAELAAWWHGSKASVSGKVFNAELDGARPNLIQWKPGTNAESKNLVGQRLRIPNH